MPLDGVDDDIVGRRGIGHRLVDQLDEALVDLLLAEDVLPESVHSNRGTCLPRLDYLKSIHLEETEEDNLVGYALGRNMGVGGQEEVGLQLDEPTAHHVDGFWE